MTTFEEPNDAARAFEANAEYVAQILEDVLSRLQIEHTEKEKVKTALVSVYQQLADQSLQLKDEINEKERTLEQVAELREHEKKLEAVLDEIKGKVDPGQATVCILCQEINCDSVLSPCGHIFHHECINNYFQQNQIRKDLTEIAGLKRTVCPSCKYEKGPPIARNAIDKKCKAGEVWDQYVILIGGGKPETREKILENEKRVRDAQAQAAAGNADAAAAAGS